ncbi:hypothetical protein EHF33_07390 [Deinococcus psychrotolerans]|uniref:Adhesin domain-containing protein n=1 Tax=Deinococcus psychrotolerans TaxID=2489213 RepID=A0A3G8YB23_9DEIO|nr:hypothetical protein [Deinococcus psychrotolerans]AZI42589.1 hypothetical protein EHF33_07390 [Deinococcus psychrotolerans]
MNSALPAWPLSAALLRLSVTLGVLFLLGVGFVFSLKPVDLKQLEAQISRVERPLGAAERLSLTLAPDLSQTLMLSGSDAPGLSAELSASREGDLKLSAAPLPNQLPSDRLPNSAQTPQKEVALTLSRTWRDWPLLIQLGGQNGLAGHLKVRVPRNVPLRLNVQQPADQTSLDLQRLNLERLTFSSARGQWNVTLPESGQPDLTFKTEDGVLKLILPEGTARSTLSATSVSGQLVLRVPLTARADLTVKQLSGATINLPPSFQELDSAGSGRDSARLRHYLQAGQPDGPQLTATLSLTGGSLTVKGVSP